MLATNKQRGDTLIEVLVAITVFSTVVLSVLAVMSQGISTAQSSLEVNLVRNQIDTQAELLKYLNNKEISGKSGDSSTSASVEWGKIESMIVANASDYDAIDDTSKCKVDVAGGSGGLPSKAFFIDPSTAKVVTKADGGFRTPETFAQVYPSTSTSSAKSEMIWVEAVYNPGVQNSDKLTASKYYDFHIRACWSSPGSKSVMKSGTIVRLYVPN